MHKSVVTTRVPSNGKGFECLWIPPPLKQVYVRGVWQHRLYTRHQLRLNPITDDSENNILHGDAASEAFLSEIVGAAPWPGQRHMNMESIYEYGSRAGFWRLWRMFTQRNMPVTVFAVATALEKNLAESQLQNTQLENQKLVEELEHQQRELTAYAMSLVRKNELLRQLQD